MPHPWLLLCCSMLYHAANRVSLSTITKCLNPKCSKGFGTLGVGIFHDTPPPSPSVFLPFLLLSSSSSSVLLCPPPLTIFFSNIRLSSSIPSPAFGDGVVDSMAEHHGQERLRKKMTWLSSLESWRGKDHKEFLASFWSTGKLKLENANYLLWFSWNTSRRPK
jgi:hypothetical protein